MQMLAPSLVKLFSSSCCLLLSLIAVRMSLSDPSNQSPAVPWTHHVSTFPDKELMQILHSFSDHLSIIGRGGWVSFIIICTKCLFEMDHDNDNIVIHVLDIIPWLLSSR